MLIQNGNSVHDLMSDRPIASLRISSVMKDARTLSRVRISKSADIDTALQRAEATLVALQAELQFNPLRSWLVFGIRVRPRH